MWAFLARTFVGLHWGRPLRVLAARLDIVLLCRPVGDDTIDRMIE